MSSSVFVVLGAVAVAAGLVVSIAWLVRHRLRRRQNLPLAGTVLVSFGVLALVTGWLLSGPSGTAVNPGEALKTGGLAAGSVVALYALWLNDRRRRVEEDRQELERSRQHLENQRYELEQRRQELEDNRAEHDRERVADERFARAVELLGAGADQVRVGALHALAGLARSRSGYTQTVLDVLCSYLRRPFDHPIYLEARGQDGTAGWSADRRLTADGERQVRLTAQRLIADLLPSVHLPDAPAYNLDLTGATLEYFDISERVVGELAARVSNLYEAFSVWGCRFTGGVWFTGAHGWGRFYAHHIEFTGKAWFSGFHAHAESFFHDSRFLGKTKLRSGVFDGMATFRDARFAGPVDLTDARFPGGFDLSGAQVATATTLGMLVARTPAPTVPAGWELDDIAREPDLLLVRA